MRINKHPLLFKIFAVIILAAFAGCAGSRVMYVDSSKLPEDNSYDILSVTMKSAEKIDVKDKNAMFHEKYKGRELVITYNEGKSEKIIALSDISQVKIEVYNERGSIAIAFSGLILMGFLIYFINMDKGD